MSVIVAADFRENVVEFTQDQLLDRWRKNYMPGISMRTLHRHISQFELKPHRRAGLRPFYAEPDVKAMEQRRRDFYLNRFDDRDDGAGIITVAKAKKIAARGRK